jgi:hypothetical protein
MGLTRTAGAQAESHRRAMTRTESSRRADSDLGAGANRRFAEQRSPSSPKQPTLTDIRLVPPGQAFGRPLAPDA